jgi:hypothetical protein
MRPRVPAIEPGPKGYTVFWRYVTKDKRYVMVNDQHHPSDRGRWVFISRTMFGRRLPGAQPSQDHRP